MMGLISLANSSHRLAVFFPLSIEGRGHEAASSHWNEMLVLANYTLTGMAGLVGRGDGVCVLGCGAAGVRRTEWGRRLAVRASRVHTGTEAEARRAG